MMKEKTLSILLICFFLPGCFLGKGNGKNTAMVLNGMVAASGALLFVTDKSDQKEDDCSQSHSCYDLNIPIGKIIGVVLMACGTVGLIATGAEYFAAPNNPQPLFDPKNKKDGDSSTWDDVIPGQDLNRKSSVSLKMR